MVKFIFPFVAGLIFLGLGSLMMYCVFRLVHKNLLKSWTPSLKFRRIVAASFIGLPVVGACLVAWEGVYPGEDFFVGEYDLVMMERPLPSSARFIRTAVSRPDPTGDYCSAALIALDQKDFDHLFATINADTMHFDRTVLGGSAELDSALGELPRNSISAGYQRKRIALGGLVRCIGFIPDRRCVIIHVCQL
jgi:hypothetical protein